jgi:ribosome-binding ATPase
MKLGIVGLSHSGKTTIFNALTHRSGEPSAGSGKVAPVQGVVTVPDERVDWLTELYRPLKKTFAHVTYLDLQAMPGALENKQEYMAQLIIHMRQVDALLMVVRNFPDTGGNPPDPIHDCRELQDEFLLADLATVEKRLERLTQEHKKGKKPLGNEKELLEACAAVLNEEMPLRSRPELATAPELRGFTFLSAKPLLVVVNNTDDDEVLPPAAFGDLEAMVVRGKLEMEMAQLPDDEAAAFREDFGITESPVDRIIRRSFALLDLAAFFTVGDDEVKAWTIHRGLPAVEAAGVVHSDMQKGFIRAEVVAYEDLRRAGDHTAARKLGLVRLEGKTYPVQDGDIINFRFNV